jgi:hypothetical protein
MEPTDITIDILKGIRDEVHSLRQDTNARLDETNARLDETNTRLARLEHRQGDAELRVRTEVTAVVGAVDRLREVLLEDRTLRRQVDDHERRLRAIET